jgi:thiamine-phosphate diphosphorylase
VNLPRVHAVTNADVLAEPGFLDRARRVASLGNQVAIHLRDRTASGRALSDHAVELRDALEGTETTLIVNARPDIATAVAAAGVQLGAGDLGVADARRVFPRGWVGRSVHSMDEARAAADDGADFVLAGTTYPSASHPGAAAKGTAFIASLVAAGAPVIAIGGITPARASEVHATGAWGIAAIRSVWGAADPADAIREMLAPWEEP